MKRSSLILAMVLCLSMCASAGTVNLRLGADGQIPAYLALGPFPNPGTEKMTCRGLNTDFLLAKGGEGKSSPVEGQKVPSTNSIPAWSLALCDENGVVDFTMIFSTTDPAVVYTYASVVSPSTMDAKLLLGSDDGVKVWLNGQLVYTGHETRGVVADSDQVNIKLVAGENRLLFKVDQHFGGWGLTARIANPDGKPIAGLTERLGVLQPKTKGADEADIVRAMSGKQGVLDMDALNRYTSRLHQTNIWMPWFKTSTDRPEPYSHVLVQIAQKVNAAKTKRPDQMSKVLADEADLLEKQFAVEKEALTKRLQTPDPLMTVSPAKEDYIQVAAGGRYFVFSDGKYFTPIGYNHNPEWPKTEECAIGRANYDPVVTDRFFKYLHDSGVNVIRMMLEAPGGGFLLENPVGTFNPDQVAFLDNIFTLARKHDIKLMITPWDTFWMAHIWDKNPYNTKNGGPVVNRVDFLTKREVIDAQKKRWKYIIDRWGNTDTVFCWELMNEIDLWWGASPEQVSAWTTEMRDFVRDYEKRKWGRNHMVVVSISKALPEGGWADDAFRLAGLDFATTHLYLGAANAPDEAIGPAAAIRQGVQYSLSQINDNRPYIDGEDGPINRWIADGKLDDAVFHNMIWAHMASGGPGSGFRWPYRFPHHLSDGMYAHLARMSTFAKDVPWQKLTGNREEMTVTEPKGWVACSYATKSAALVWLTGDKPSSEPVRITWSAGPQSVSYRCYDTLSGQWVGKGIAQAKDGVFEIPVIGDRTSIAILLEGS